MKRIAAKRRRRERREWRGGGAGDAFERLSLGGKRVERERVGSNFASSGDTSSAAWSQSRFSQGRWGFDPGAMFCEGCLKPKIEFGRREERVVVGGTTAVAEPGRRDVGSALQRLWAGGAANLDAVAWARLLPTPANCLGSAPRETSNGGQPGLAPQGKHSTFWSGLSGFHDGLALGRRPVAAGIGR